MRSNMGPAEARAAHHAFVAEKAEQAGDYDRAALFYGMAAHANAEIAADAQRDPWWVRLLRRVTRPDRE